MLVLVLGASGFIGRPVAQALVRAGHLIYGQARSISKAQESAADEIIPVIGDPSSPSTWSHLIPTLDVIIDATRGSDVATLPALNLSNIADAVSRLRPAGAPRLSYILTSGTWVHGDSRTQYISDTTPITAPAKISAARPAVEQAVVTHPSLNGIVIRPALLYGRAGSLFASMFASAAAGKAQWYGTPGGRFALVHTDDLADLFVRVAERAQLVGGKIFDAANDFTESVDDILANVSKVAGATAAPEYLDPAGNAFNEALGTTTLLRPYLARALLGWQPRKPSMVDGTHVYYAAWKATQ